MTEGRGEPKGCCPPGGSCGPSGLDASRRDFVKAALAGSAGIWFAGARVMAGPFQGADESGGVYRRVIPADKKLNPDWVRSLYDRGAPAVYRGQELDFIGMPVGGLFAGQLYLGGDGTLWLWDVFNEYGLGVGGTGQNGENYVKPQRPHSPVRQGFAVRVKTPDGHATRSLDRKGFPGVSFQGQYPIGLVRYEDPAFPLAVSLEAFSPFIPLDVGASSFPATILRFKVKNVTGSPVAAELAGYLENPVCLHSQQLDSPRYRNRVQVIEEGVFLGLSALPKPTALTPKRDPVVFEDFESGYGAWKIDGEAFGTEPAEGGRGVQKLSGFEGRRLVNGWQNTDERVGKLTSPEFRIERRFVNFLLGGGNHPNETRIDLVVDGTAARTATGRNSDAMDWASWDVRELEGKTARFEIVDTHRGGWGHIDVDQIEFSDERRFPRAFPPLTERGDFGSAALLLLGKGGDRAAAAVARDADLDTIFGALRRAADETSESDDRRLGAVGRAAVLAPGEEIQVDVLLTWHFPHLRLPGFEAEVGRHYATRWTNALAVAREAASRLEDLTRRTRLWRDTWYDSSLPHWLLDRTFVNISTLATSTAHRFQDGRFWAWEGVGCCHGTCTHVWHYAWAVGRLFPEMERSLRENVDFKIGFDTKTGGVGMRAEFDRTPADDGQAGIVLRTYRDHLMSSDGAFLTRNWPRVKQVVEYLLARDPNGDGILDGPQPNTLDAAWFGEIAWTSSLYLAALRAAEEMARICQDDAFAVKCRTVFDRGAKNLPERLYNGEYFTQTPDPAHLDAIGTDAGCYIDQVFGQSWAWHVGLGRLYDGVKIQSALRSLWKHNFTMDVGPFRAIFKEGRPYALAGDGGLVMCTWPKGGLRQEWKKHWQFGYFNECMSGFEHQVAAHMVWEGLVEEGLAIERAIHDRYHPSRRNPFNEIECSDHYARAMSSYGVFLAACGFECDGPAGVMGFDPKLEPNKFKAAFTTAEGWGSYSQDRGTDRMACRIDVRDGSLTLREFRATVHEVKSVASVAVKLGEAPIKATLIDGHPRMRVQFEQPVRLRAGDALDVRFEFT